MLNEKRCGFNERGNAARDIRSFLYKTRAAPVRLMQTPGPQKGKTFVSVTFSVCLFISACGHNTVKHVNMGVIWTNPCCSRRQPGPVWLMHRACDWFREQEWWSIRTNDGGFSLPDSISHTGTDQVSLSKLKDLREPCLLLGQRFRPTGIQTTWVKSLIHEHQHEYVS